MRETYGKLVYVLMDAQIPEVQDMLGFSCVRPIVTVHSVLEAAGAGDMLRDPLIGPATREILADGKSRRDVQKAIKPRC